MESKVTAMNAGSTVEWIDNFRGFATIFIVL